jgi:hypothetical protein
MIDKIKKMLSYVPVPLFYSVCQKDVAFEFLDQLEVDAELGRAVRLWFSKGGIIERSRVEIWNTSELIEWAKEVNQC